MVERFCMDKLKHGYFAEVSFLQQGNKQQPAASISMKTSHFAAKLSAEVEMGKNCDDEIMLFYLCAV